MTNNLPPSKKALRLALWVTTGSLAFAIGFDNSLAPITTWLLVAAVAAVSWKTDDVLMSDFS